MLTTLNNYEIYLLNTNRYTFDPYHHERLRRTYSSLNNFVNYLNEMFHYQTYSESKDIHEKFGDWKENVKNADFFIEELISLYDE